MPPFLRLVIETTGLADPAPILRTLMNDPMLVTRFRLDGVIDPGRLVGAGLYDPRTRTLDVRRWLKAEA